MTIPYDTYQDFLNLLRRVNRQAYVFLTRKAPFYTEVVSSTTLYPIHVFDTNELPQGYDYWYDISASVLHYKQAKERDMNNNNYKEKINTIKKYRQINEVFDADNYAPICSTCTKSR